MVAILRKIMQVIRAAKGPVLKFLAPLINSFAPGVGDLVTTGANELVERAGNTYDAYEAAKEAGQPFKFHDGVKAFLAPRPPGAVKTKTKEYGDIHPRLQLDGD
jgi:hypothetical protein